MTIENSTSAGQSQQTSDTFTVSLEDAPQEQPIQVDQSDPSVTYFEKDPATGEIKMVGWQSAAPPPPIETAQVQQHTPTASHPADKPGFIPVKDDFGNILTWIPNDPEVISQQTFGDKKYISELHRMLDENGIPRPGHSSPKHPKSSTPTQPTAIPPMDRAALVEKAKSIASTKFPAVDSEGRALDVTPIAETIAEMLEAVVAPANAQLSELRQQAEQSRVVAQYQSEIAEIQQYDSRFTLDDFEVRRMAQMHPDWSPKQIHRELIYLESMNGNKTASIQQHQPQASHSPTPKQTVQPSMFQTPGNGSSPAPHLAQDNSSDVVEAVKAYEDAMRYYGKPATEDGRRMVRAQAIAQRNANPDKSIILRTN